MRIRLDGLGWVCGRISWAAIVLLVLLALGASFTPALGAQTGPEAVQASDTAAADVAGAAESAVGRTARAPEMELELVDQLGGAIADLVIVGQRGYVAHGTRLLTVDLSKPASLQVVHRSASLGDTVNGLAADEAGERLFAAVGERGVLVFGLDPTAAPVLLASTPVGTPREPLRAASVVALGSGEAYVLAQTERHGRPLNTMWYLRAAEDAAEAAQLTRLDGPALSRVDCAAVRGQSLYVVGDLPDATGGELGLAVLDATERGAPALISTTPLSLGLAAEGCAISVSERHAVLTGPYDSTWVVDVADAMNPRPYGAPLGVAGAAVLREPYLFLGVRDFVSTFELRPASKEAVELGRFDALREDPSGGQIHFLRASDDGETLYAGLGYAGMLFAIDATDPSAPAIEGRLELLPQPIDVVTEGDRLYMLDTRRTVRVFSGARAGALVERGSYRLPAEDPVRFGSVHHPWGKQYLAARDGIVWAVVNDDWRGSPDGAAYAVDMRDPAAPALIATRFDTTDAGAAAVVSSRTHLVVQTVHWTQPPAGVMRQRIGRLHVYRWLEGDSTEPALVGTVDGWLPWGAPLDGGRLVASRPLEDQIVLYDLADGSSGPRAVSTIDVDHYRLSATFVGDTVFYADPRGTELRWATVHAEDHALQKRAGQVRHRGGDMGLVAGYLASPMPAELYVMDVTPRSRPNGVAEVGLPSALLGSTHREQLGPAMAVAGDTMYLATGAGGLLSYRLAPVRSGRMVYLPACHRSPPPADHAPAGDN